MLVDEGVKSRSKFLDVDRAGQRGPIERTRSNSWNSKKLITDSFLGTSLARRGSKARNSMARKSCEEILVSPETMGLDQSISETKVRPWPNFKNSSFVNSKKSLNGAG